MPPSLSYMVISIASFIGCCISVSDQLCTSPVFYSNTDIVIYGPCPNGTFIAPIHSTAQLRCDYTDQIGSFKLQFWFVLLFEPGIIFPGEEVNDIFRVSASTNDQSGYTILTINVTELSIKFEPITPITIQCGMCLSVGCSQNPVEKGILSNSAFLVTFGSPCCLIHYVKLDKLILKWSPSNDSAGHVGLNYTYEVVLRNTFNSIVVNTTNTTLMFYIANINFCTKYSWSVTAITLGRRSSPTNNTANEVIVLFSAPKIISVVKMDNILYCNESIIISVILSIKSVQSLDKLNYSLRLIIDSNEVAVRPRSIKEIDGILIELEFSVLYPVDDDFNDLSINISVNASNECGSDVSDNIIIEFDDIQMCGLISSISQSVVHPQSSIDIITSSTWVIHSDMSADGKDTRLIIILCIEFSLFTLSVTTVLVIMAAWKLRSKRKQNYRFESDNLDSLNMTTQELQPQDYITPVQANHQLHVYKQDHHSQYCEPKALRSYSCPILPLPPVDDDNDDRVNEFEEVPLYSEVIQKSNNDKTKMSTRSVKSAVVIGPLYDEIKF